MPQPPSTTSDRAQLLRVLRAAQGRLEAQRWRRAVATGFTWSLAVPLALSVWHRFGDVPSSILVAAGTAWVVGLAAWIVWQRLPRSGLGRAASTLDQRARLHDELASAHWFSQAPEPSAWVGLQMRRAAETTSRLSLEALCPLTKPSGLHRTAGVVALLVALNLVPLSWTRGWLEAQPTLTESEARRLDELERLLAELDAMESLQLSEHSDAVLQALRKGELQPDELRELQAMLADLEGLESARLEGVLEGMAEVLAAVDARMAEALLEQDLTQAAEQLRALAERLDSIDPERLQESLEAAAAEAQESLEQLAAELAEAAEQLREENPELVEQALERAAQELERMAELQETADLRDSVARELQQLEQAMGQESNQAGQQQLAEDGAMPQEGEAGLEGGMPNTGQAMAVQAAQSQDPDSMQQGGDVSAPGTGDQIDYGAPTEMDVELQLELVDIESAAEDGSLEERLVDQPSPAASSILAFEPVDGATPYTAADAVEVDHIPPAYRPLVKRYFQVVGPREQHDH